MATKQSALRAQKQAKRAAASKQKQKKANIARNQDSKLLGRREDARMMADIATHGVKAAALNIHDRSRHKNKKSKGEPEFEELTNAVVMQNITNVLPSIIRLHAGVEAFEILGRNEKRFDITDEQTALINEFDERVVWVMEDVNAISQFIEDNREPEHYSEVYLHLVQTLAQISADSQQPLIDMLSTQKDMIDQYAIEHCGSKPMFAFQHELHGLRMLRVGKAYATKLAADFAEAQAKAEHNYTPEAPQPLDPVEGTLQVEPDLVKDVEPAAEATEQSQ